MGEETKPLRFKDIRSSTASDRGTDNDKNEDANEIVVNLLMKTKKEANLVRAIAFLFSFLNDLKLFEISNKIKNKEDALETSSIKSSSSISTPLTSNSTSNSINKSKLDTASVKSSTAAQSRKRRPSVSVEQTISPPSQPATTQPKAKRRKSGR